MRLERTLPAMTAIAVLMLTLTACGGNSPAEAPENRPQQAHRESLYRQRRYLSPVRC